MKNILYFPEFLVSCSDSNSIAFSPDRAQRSDSDIGRANLAGALPRWLSLRYPGVALSKPIVNSSQIPATPPQPVHKA
jgi:hypothetical protein